MPAWSETRPELFSLPYPSASLEHMLFIFSGCEITRSSAIWFLQFVVRGIISLMGASVPTSAAGWLRTCAYLQQATGELSLWCSWGIICPPFLPPKCDFSCPLFLQIAKTKSTGHLENIWFFMLYSLISQMWAKKHWCFSPSVSTEVDCVLDLNNLPRYKAIWLRSYLR